jgi:hypothetical protein
MFNHDKASAVYKKLANYVEAEMLLAPTKGRRTHHESSAPKNIPAKIRGMTSIKNSYIMEI